MASEELLFRCIFLTFVQIMIPGKEKREIEEGGHWLSNRRVVVIIVNFEVPL